MAVVVKVLATLTLYVFIVLFSCEEVLSDINYHVDQQIKDSFVSFRIYNRHACGGARLQRKLVLITLSCKFLFVVPLDEIAPVIPALPEQDRSGYTIKHIKQVETIYFLVTLKLPKRKMSRDVGLVPLPETSPDCESGGVILGWDQSNNTIGVISIANIAYTETSVTVYDDFWNTDLLFQAQYVGALLIQEKRLIGFATVAVSEPQKKCVFEKIINSARKIEEAMKKPSIFTCFAARNSD